MYHTSPSPRVRHLSLGVTTKHWHYGCNVAILITHKRVNNKWAYDGNIVFISKITAIKDKILSVVLFLSFNLAIDGWPKDVGEPFPRG